MTEGIWLRLKPEEYVQFSKDFGIDWRPAKLEALKQKIGTSKPTLKQRLEIESHEDAIFWGGRMLEWAGMARERDRALEVSAVL